MSLISVCNHLIYSSWFAVFLGLASNLVNIRLCWSLVINKFARVSQKLSTILPYFAPVKLGRLPFNILGWACPAMPRTLNGRLYAFDNVFDISLFPTPGLPNKQ